MWHADVSAEILNRAKPKRNGKNSWSRSVKKGAMFRVVIDPGLYWWTVQAIQSILSKHSACETTRLTIIKFPNPEKVSVIIAFELIPITWKYTWIGDLPTERIIFDEYHPSSLICQQNKTNTHKPASQTSSTSCSSFLYWFVGRSLTRQCRHLCKQCRWKQWLNIACGDVIKCRPYLINKQLKIIILRHTRKARLGLISLTIYSEVEPSSWILNRNDGPQSHYLC